MRPTFKNPVCAPALIFETIQITHLLCLLVDHSLSVFDLF